MQMKSDLQKGWEFATNILGVDYVAQNGRTYVDAVEEAIKRLEEGINNHPYSQQDVKQFQGYAQEKWHEGTYNIDAIAFGSKDSAKTLDSTLRYSPDIVLNSGDKYSLKSFSTAKQSGIEQAKLNDETGFAAYHGQKRLVPSDQLADAKIETHERVIKNILTRPEVSNAFDETEKNLTDRVINQEGVSSIPATREKLIKIARDGNQHSFSAEEHGVTLDTAIKTEYIMKQALKAGYTSAAITVAMQLAPEVYKAIDYLIKHGEIDVAQVKQMGNKAITTSAEGFLRGSVAYSLFVMCEKGALGSKYVGVDPTLLGTIVVIVMQTVKNSILVSVGRMTPRQMGNAFADTLLISGGYYLGSKLGSVIGQTLGFKLPVVGYLLGSLVGTSFAVVYNMGKKNLIAFCVDTGFTCFGLVDQNYELLEDVLNEIGINTITIQRTDVNRTKVSNTLTENYVNRADYETINITILRRGVIGVNKVGYVF